MEGMGLKRFVNLLFAVLFLTVLPLTAMAAKNPVPKANQAVVCIVSGIYYQNGRAATYNGCYGMGTGFGVGRSGEDAQIFVTNNHVISDSNAVPYDRVYIMVDDSDFRDESSVIPCEILYADADTDLAIIKAAAPVSGVGTLPLRSAVDIPTGEAVYALGFPGISDAVADQNRYTVGDITVTDGIVSRHLQANGINCMAQTAKVNHGNSGGPLIDTSGNAIGINTFIYVDADNADLRCYAIYIDYAMKALDNLGLPYVQASDGGTNGWLLIAVPAAVAAAAVAAVVLLRRRKSQDGQADTGRATRRILLQAVSGPLQGRSWELTAALTVGRAAGEDVMLPPDTPGISRSHCLLTRQDDRVTLTDLGSSYGTFLNGSRLSPNQPVTVPNGGVIALASDAVWFRILIE